MNPKDNSALAGAMCAVLVLTAIEAVSLGLDEGAKDMGMLVQRGVLTVGLLISTMFILKGKILGWIIGGVLTLLVLISLVGIFIEHPNSLTNPGLWARIIAMVLCLFLTAKKLIARGAPNQLVQRTGADARR